MEYITTQEARKDLVTYVERCRSGERIVLSRCGRPALALVPMSDLERLQEMDWTEKQREDRP